MKNNRKYKTGKQIQITLGRLKMRKAKQHGHQKIKKRQNRKEEKKDDIKWVNKLR